MTRAEFERWIAEDLASVGATMDEALSIAGVNRSQITRVFMTGGSALVPAVRQLFAGKFGEEKLVGGDEFSSVAQGLALMGVDPGFRGEVTTPLEPGSPVPSTAS